MKIFSAICAVLASVVLHLARVALASLGLVVLYGVVCRYAFNDAPPYVEQVALILVISVVKLLPPSLRLACSALVDTLTLLFSGILLLGSVQMGLSTLHDSIPTLGISEAWRYLPLSIAAALIFLFAIEHLLGLWLARASAPQASSTPLQPHRT